jgi:hypothetical protein
VSCHCNDRLDLGAERYLVRGETIHTSVGCFHASLFLGTTGQTFLVEEAVAPWRKGVEDANRISQRLQAERDEWERNARELGMNGVCGKCGGPRWASAETISRLKAAAQAVVDQYRACREANSMSGFWSVLDDLAAELDGRAAEAPMTWGVSTDEELFHGHYATKEEALAAAQSELALAPGQRFWVGGGRPYRPTRSVDVDALLDRLGDDAGDACGEIAEGWPDPGTMARLGLEKEAHAAVMRVLERTGNLPKFYCCEVTEEHTAPASPQATTTEARRA